MMTEMDDDVDTWMVTKEEEALNKNDTPSIAGGSVGRLACALGAKTVFACGVFAMVSEAIAHTEW